MPDERLVQIAVQLRLLHVSGAGITELLSNYPVDQIEAQLKYLPYRKKTRRPEAFIIEAVRKNYSPPKEFFYASSQTQSPRPKSTVDKDSQHLAGPADTDAQGH